MDGDSMARSSQESGLYSQSARVELAEAMKRKDDEIVSLKSNMQKLIGEHQIRERELNMRLEEANLKVQQAENQSKPIQQRAADLERRNKLLEGNREKQHKDFEALMGELDALIKQVKSTADKKTEDVSETGAVTLLELRKLLLRTAESKKEILSLKHMVRQQKNVISELTSTIEALVSRKKGKEREAEIQQLVKRLKNSSYSNYISLTPEDLTLNLPMPCTEDVMNDVLARSDSNQPVVTTQTIAGVQLEEDMDVTYRAEPNTRERLENGIMGEERGLNRETGAQGDAMHGFDRQTLFEDCDQDDETIYPQSAPRGERQPPEGANNLRMTATGQQPNQINIQRNPCEGGRGDRQRDNVNQNINLLESNRDKSPVEGAQGPQRGGNQQPVVLNNNPLVKPSAGVPTHNIDPGDGGAWQPTTEPTHTPTGGSTTPVQAEGEEVHTCPFCDREFSTAMDIGDYQQHVLDCMGEEEEGGGGTIMNSPPSMEIARPRSPAPQPVTETIPPVLPSDTLTRVCPMCNAEFYGTVPQTEFERHVNLHFAD